MKAGRIDSTKLPTDAKQAYCLRCYLRGKHCLLLWSAVITSHAAVCQVVWQPFDAAVASKGLTASQRCCCNPPGLPACCTVVVSDRGVLEEAALAVAAASVTSVILGFCFQQHG